jgi:hypothetical protein
VAAASGVRDAALEEKRQRLHTTGLAQSFAYRMLVVLTLVYTTTCAAGVRDAALKEKRQRLGKGGNALLTTSHTQQHGHYVACVCACLLYLQVCAMLR